MASETLTERVAALEVRLTRLDAEYKERTRRLDRAIEELKRAARTRDREDTTRAEQLATVTAHTAALQRQSDRGWGLWQALLVLAISIAASAVTQLALHK